MPKHPSPGRVKTHLVYNVWEAADLLGLHRQTVLRWIKIEQLPIDSSSKPWLIQGRDLKAFLRSRRKSRKRPCKFNEIYCLPCHSAKEPAGKMVEYSQKTLTTGTLAGICPDCTRLIHRFIKRDQLTKIQLHLDVTYSKAKPRIVEPTIPPVRINITDKELPNGKVQSR